MKQKKFNKEALLIKVKAAKVIWTRFIAVITVLILAMSMIGCSGSDEENSSGSQTSNSPLDDIDFHILYKNVPDDPTGNWRIVTTADGVPVHEYALDYYNKYFESDEEVHMIVNYNLHTTTSIISMSGMLFVNVYEYVDKEEHSAKTLCGGMHLGEYHVNIKTGETEEIQ